MRSKGAGVFCQHCSGIRSSTFAAGSGCASARSASRSAALLGSAQSTLRRREDRQSFQVYLDRPLLQGIFTRRCRFSSVEVESLSAVQKRSRVQPVDAVGLKRSLPGQKFLFRHLIAVTRLLKGDHAAGHCHYNRGFATSPPPLSVWGRQLEHRLDSSH